MAAVQRTGFNFAETRQQFEQQQNKPPSSGLRSFMHRRNNSDGDNLTSSFQTSSSSDTNGLTSRQDPDASPKKRRPVTMAFPKFPMEAQPPAQFSQTGNAGHPPSPTKAYQGSSHDCNNETTAAPRSPSKTNLPALSPRFSSSMSSSSSHDKSSLREPPPTTNQPNKPRSATNLKGLFLSRPKSNKNLSIATDQDSSQGKNKENRKPSDSTDSPSTPIYAQFSRGPLGAVSVPSSPYETPLDPFSQASLLNLNHSFRPAAAPANSSGKKPRPKSFQPQYTSKPDPPRKDDRKETRGRQISDEIADDSRESRENRPPSTWAKARSGSRARVLSAISTMGGQKPKSPSPQPEASEPQIDPKEIDKHLEAMLDRRNIPENQRYKMRNLNSTIKMEFIRQDWAESEGRRLGRPSTNDSNDSSVNNSKNSRSDASDKKHSRGRSFTFSRNSWKIGTSPTKSKKKEATVKGHSRNKSADSTTNDRPASSGGASYSSNAFIAKVTGQQPSDFVNYLRKVQKPEAVEVGKLHKLRLLLRNERVAWTEDFIKQGGMKEIVGLLHRIMAVEWR